MDNGISLVATIRNIQEIITVLLHVKFPRVWMVLFLQYCMIGMLLFFYFVAVNGVVDVLYVVVDRIGGGSRFLAHQAQSISAHTVILPFSINEI